jgi:hypothetical protein
MRDASPAGASGSTCRGRETVLRPAYSSRWRQRLFFCNLYGGKQELFCPGKWFDSRRDALGQGAGVAGLHASKMLPGGRAMDTKTSLLVALAVVVLMLIGFGLFPL